MQRKSFIKLLLSALGYIVLGNVMCLVMTMAVSMFGLNWFTKILAIVCCTAVFFMLIFTAAWKDGVRERSLVKLGRVECELKHRWVLIGIVAGFIAAVPTIILLLNKLFFPQEDTLFVYRFISGSAYPFVLAFVEPVITESMAWEETTLRQIDNMSPLFPALMLIYYALIPVVSQIGYRMGFNDTLNSDKIMYK